MDLGVHSHHLVHLVQEVLDLINYSCTKPDCDMLQPILGLYVLLCS